MSCATAYPAPTESCAVDSALAGSPLPAVASARCEEYTSPPAVQFTSLHSTVQIKKVKALRRHPEALGGGAE